MRESSLHNTLKYLYAGEDGITEAEVDGYIVDVIQGDLLIEIQTRHFHTIKNKLNHLLQNHKVRVVHPIAQKKYIVNLAKDGTSKISRRKSTKTGRYENLFEELVRIPQLISHPGFSIEVLLTYEEEIRTADGMGSWRRRGISILDHKLLEIRDRFLVSTPQDLIHFLPEDLPSPFTTTQLAERIAITPRLSRKMIYCYKSIDIVKSVGKQGNAILYIKA